MNKGGCFGKDQACLIPTNIKFQQTLGMAVLASILLAGLPFARADEGTDEMNPDVVKNYHGLQFKVPEDWPIEKVGNTIGPIPIEEYMGRKFNDLNLRLKKQEDAMAAMEKRLATVERRKRLNG